MISFAPKCRADDRVKHLSVSARVTEHTQRGIFLLRVIKAERERDFILVFCGLQLELENEEFASYFRCLYRLYE